MGISNGIQPLLGYCYGAGKRKRFMGILKFSSALTLVCGSILTIVYIVFSKQIMGIFIDNSKVIQYGVPMLIAASLAGPVLGLMFLSINSMQALDRPLPATILSLCRQGLFFIPLLFILNQIFGLDGISYIRLSCDTDRSVYAVLIGEKSISCGDSFIDDSGSCKKIIIGLYCSPVR